MRRATLVLAALAGALSGCPRWDNIQTYCKDDSDCEYEGEVCIAHQCIDVETAGADAGTPPADAGEGAPDAGPCVPSCLGTDSRQKCGSSSSDGCGGSCECSPAQWGSDWGCKDATRLANSDDGYCCKRVNVPCAEHSECCSGTCLLNIHTCKAL